MYVSYTESQGQDEAKQLILEIIEEEYQYFSPDGISKSSTKEELARKIEELTGKMETAADYDMQVYYAEKVDALQMALDALDFE